MKTNTKFLHLNIAAKRLISFATALVLFIGSIPLSDFPIVDDLFNSRIVAHAEDRYGKDPTLTSYAQVVDYSKNFEDYASVHYDDKITIAIASGGNTEDLTGFKSLGTYEFPFAGSITINGNSYDNFNIDTAFFDYVYDHVQITSPNPSKIFTICPTGDFNSNSVFANHVMHDNRTATTYGAAEEGKTQVTPAEWNLKIGQSGSKTPEHGSAIGTMESGACLTVSLTNDYGADVSVSSASDDESGLDVNAGVICGTLKATSSLTVKSISGVDMASVTSANGNAGGLVGEMEPNSTLKISSDSTFYLTPNSEISAAQYAGGLVGKNDQGTLTISGSYTNIQNDINGALGAGGLFGYFKPIMSSNAYSLNLDTFKIGVSSDRCKVGSAGGAGGFFGILDNPGGTITLSGTNANTIYSSSYVDGTTFGGIIGSYQATALTDTLKIEGGSELKLTVNTARSGSSLFYGGVIGKINDARFVSISNVNVSASNPDQATFGGAVASADDAYVYVDNFKLTASAHQGGGIIGHTSNGVVHLAGNTDLSAASANTSSANYGQIVGFRDSALVFAESGWTLTRNSTNNSADDIGSWGEVVRFKDSGFTINSLLSDYYISSDTTPKHYVTLIGATIDEDTGKIVLSSKSTFATAALNMQINGGVNTDVIKFADTTDSRYSVLSAKDVAMTADIDLSHTGMTGLTRDNYISSWESGIGPQYSGSSFDAGYTENGTKKKYILTLAIGEGYQGNDTINNLDGSGKGKIYRHAYNGLFGETTSDFTVSNVTIKGKVHTYTQISIPTFYVGTIAGNALASFNATGVSVDSTTSIVYGTSNRDKNSQDAEIYVGGLVGKMSDADDSTIGSTTANDSSFNASISGTSYSDNTYVGGVSGWVEGGNVTVNNIKIGGNVSGNSEKYRQSIAGLFAYATGTLDLDNISVDTLTVSGKLGTNSNGCDDTDNINSIGGLLGYKWDNTTVTFDGISVSGCTLNNQSTGGRMAGLVYTGSGYWQVNDVEIDGLTITGTTADSFGMIVNKAWSGDSAMYLELPSGFTYTIDNVTTTMYQTTVTETVDDEEVEKTVDKYPIESTTVYDEIAAFSKYGDNDIEENGNSVISINTTGTTIYGTQSDSVENGTTIKTKVNMSTGTCNTYQNQVTEDGFNTYNPNTRYYYNLDNYKAAPAEDPEKLLIYSLVQYAHDSISDNFNDSTDGAFSGSYDMDGYSYYPFDVTGSISIDGSVKFYNEAIETKESSSEGGSDGYARTTLVDTENNTTTQHYLMHAGLFRNVSSSVTITDEFKIDGTIPVVNGYSGAIICGTIGGNTETDAVFDSSDDGKIVLDGIKVHNKTSYSPLLINKADGYVVLDVYNVSADSTKYNAGSTIATSLLGDIGSDTAQKVQLTFSNIKLDGRDAGNTAESGLTAYGTTRSLFTNATLCESLSYVVGSDSTGVYNYEYDEDWGKTNGVLNRSVTYGKEISEETSTNKGKEYYYYKKFGNADYFTNPLRDSETADRSSVYDFSGFLPYVAVWGDDITKTTQHQLDVNHAAATFSGCGTYNDPYIIAYDSNTEGSVEDGGLTTISKIIVGGSTNLAGTSLYLPDDLTDTWCENKDSCKLYTYNSDNDAFEYTYTDDQEIEHTLSHASTDVRSYLCRAYYYLSSNITLSTDFKGLGIIDSNYYFHGVISGNGKTVTNNSGSPLIVASNGSVVKKLTVSIGGANIAVSGDKAAYDLTTGNCGAYGAVVGKVFGGDNIIDEVGVVFDANTKIVPGGTTYLAPIGGYIGVVLNGGVYFRNMDDVRGANKVGLTDSNFSTAGHIGDNNTAYLYCNPIIGRVVNGFAVNESDAYRPFEDGSRTYGDGSKDYWQADGSVVTKTAKQLEDDPTLDETMKASAAKVTLRNGNKNYSITDIDPDEENMLGVSGTAITVPNAQAFFVMSLIVNSGMGTKTNPVIGYYGTDQITRHGNYDYVNTAIKLTETTTDDYKDYHNIDQNDKNNKISYLIEQYASSGAEELGKDTYTLLLSNSIYLPDGYKGIGNFYQNSNYLRLALSEFNGNNKIINQNTTNYSYDPNSLDNYVPDYAATYKDSNKEQYYSSASGFGLFNCQTQYGDYKNVTLTGNVKSLVYLSDGGIIQYLASNLSVNDKTRAQSVGGLFGTISYSTSTGDTVNIINVKLDNVDIQSAKYAGGLIGFIPLNEKYDKSWDNKTINITNSSSSQKINVTGGLNAGGLIGFFYMGNINIDYNNNHFDITKIESLCLKQFGDTVASGAQYDLGCGGLLGVMRCNSTSNTLNGINCNTARVSNIIIGKTDTTYNGTVEATKYAGSNDPIYVGGVFGVLNRSPLIADNITVNNISVKGDSCTGGIVGWAGTNSQPTITNTTLFSNNGSEIGMTRYNKGQTGGFLGFNKSDTQTFTLISCKISGYTIQHQGTAGGVLGKWSANFPFDVKNFEISNCIIKANTNAGGIAGTLDSGKTLSGHNIYEKNIKICKYNNASQLPTNYGCVIGSNSGIIKIVGFTRQDDQETSTMVNKVTGSGSYGTGGYIVFADYDGICDSLSKNTTFSTINNLNNVSSTLIVETIDKKEIKTQDSSRKAISFETKISTGSDSLTAGKTITKTVVTHDKNTVYTIVETVYNASGEIISGPTTTTSTTNDYGLASTSEGRTKTIITTRNVIKVSTSPYVTMNPSITIDNIDGATGLLTSDGISKTAVTNILTDINAEKSNKRYQNTGVDITTNLWDPINNKVNGDIVSTFKDELGTVITGRPYDFPMLVINDTDTADAVLNDYLRVLTNTNMDFSNNVSGQTYGSVGGSTNIATVTIQKCTYNDGSYTLSTDKPCLTINGNEFKINKDADNNDREMYDTVVATGQFTLIDIAFKDPENTDEVAYHLYVPVIVKKLLEYKFDIAVESGSTYDRTLYTSRWGLPMLENLGTPVTFAFEYNYLRSATDWAKETGSTDYYYPKYLTLTNSGDYNISSKVTQLLLIDMNRGGKPYYLNSWDGTSAINLQSFTDDSGAPFEPMTFKDMITDQGIEGDEQLTEKYYLTIFTDPYGREEEDESTIVSHYAVTSQAFNDADHPSRRLNCDDQDPDYPHNYVHLIIGDFYTNDLTVLTSTEENSDCISEDNMDITVDLTADVKVVNDHTLTAIEDYLSLNSVKIYQSFLVLFDKYKDTAPLGKGISAIDSCEVPVYTITRTTDGATTTIPFIGKNTIIKSGYIEFQNNKDISNELKLGDIQYRVQTVLSFNSERTRGLQFPLFESGDEDPTGSIVIGKSNISSNSSNTAYSSVSRQESDGGNHYYYTLSEESAGLKYYADYTGATRANQKDMQLGINAREIESTDQTSTVYTEARYDASKLLRVDDIKYITCTIELLQRNDQADNAEKTYDEKIIANYLRNLNVNGVTAQNAAASTTQKYVFVFDVEDVAQFENEENVFKIPITFDVITGNQTSFKDNSSYIYANYKVKLTVSAFDHNGASDKIIENSVEVDAPWSDYISNSKRDDHIIYTNARIYTDLIKKVG